jgi:hypothetical protein
MIVKYTQSVRAYASSHVTWNKKENRTEMRIVDRFALQVRYLLCHTLARKISKCKYQAKKYEDKSIVTVSSNVRLLKTTWAEQI